MNTSEKAKKKVRRGRSRTKGNRSTKRVRPEGIDPWTPNDWYDGIPEDKTADKSKEPAPIVTPKRKLTLEEYRERRREQQADKSKVIPSTQQPKRKITLQQYRERRRENNKDESPEKYLHKCPEITKHTAAKHFIPEEDSNVRPQAAEIHPHINGLYPTPSSTTKGCESSEHHHSYNAPVKRTRNTDRNDRRRREQRRYWDDSYSGMSDRVRHLQHLKAGSYPKICRHVPNMSSSDTYICSQTDSNSSFSIYSSLHYHCISSCSYNNDRFRKRHYEDAFLGDDTCTYKQHRMFV